MGPLIYGKLALNEALAGLICCLRRGTVYADSPSSPSSHLTGTITVHCHLLREYCAHALLCYWCKSILRRRYLLALSWSNDSNMLTLCAAWKYYLDITRCDCPTRGAGVVPHQLLPHGLDRATIRRRVRPRSDNCLDERLNRTLKQSIDQKRQFITASHSFYMSFVV
jgi:hypothetical protein